MEWAWKLAVFVLVGGFWALSIRSLALDRAAILKELSAARADVAATDKNLMVLKEELVPLKMRVARIEEQVEKWEREAQQRQLERMDKIDRERQRKEPRKRIWER